MKGAKAEEYKGVAQFFKFLASTENQAWWAGVTGYLPLTQRRGQGAWRPRATSRRTRT